MNKIKQLDDLDYMPLDEFLKGTYQPFEYYYFHGAPRLNITISFPSQTIDIRTGDEVMNLKIRRILDDNKDLSIHIDIEKKVFSLKKGILPSIEFFRVNFDNYIMANIHRVY